MNRTRPCMAGWLAATLPPLALGWPTLRHLIEGRMFVHMLLELPLLLVSGIACGRCLRRVARARPALGAMELLDRHGWMSMSLVTCVVAFWMLPSAIDASLLSTKFALAKYAAWWCSGFMLADGWGRTEPEVRLFAVGSLAWMMATAGLLYGDTTSRLCVNYLIDDQRLTGVGLVVSACIVGGWTLGHVARASVKRESPPEAAIGPELVDKTLNSAFWRKALALTDILSCMRRR